MKKLKERLHAIDKEFSAVLAVLLALLVDNADSVMQAIADHLPELVPYLSADAVRVAGVLGISLKVILAVRKAKVKESSQ